MIASWGIKKFNASSKKVYTFDGFTNSGSETRVSGK
jgi:hypothetical protein